MLGWLTQGRALARYRLNRIILHCGSAFFHLSQLHMGQRKGVNTPGLEVPVRLSPLLFTAVVRVSAVFATAPPPPPKPPPNFSVSASGSRRICETRQQGHIGAKECRVFDPIYYLNVYVV